MSGNQIVSLSEDFKSIFFIRGLNSARYPYSNSLLLGDYLIDTGISPRILKQVQNGHQISNIILSHWHEDHIGGNFLIENANILAHLKDKAVIEDVSKMIPYYAMENTEIGKEFEKLFDVLLIRNTPLDNLIEHDEVIKIDNELALKIIHTPGHTAGHCCFYELNSKIAFLADIDLTRFPFYGNIDGNLIDYYDSIEKLRKLDIEIAVSSHKDITIGINEVKNQLEQFRLILDKRSERVLNQLSENHPKNIDHFINKNLIYRNYSNFGGFEIIAEKLMIQMHLDKLLVDGNIEVVDNGYVLS